MTSEEGEECIFCNIIKGDAKSGIVKSSDNFIAIKDVNPVAEGHLLIIPKQHYATLLDIPDGLGKEMLQFVKSIATEDIWKKLGDGFNIIMNNLPAAGQFVMHAHIHLIPRKKDDGIRFLIRK